MLEKKLKEYLDNQLNISFPGYSFALVKKYETPLFIANGKLNYLDEKDNGTASSIYDLAFLTKVIATTTAILKLLETGKIHLNQKVKEILPSFYDEFTTIYHLLTHTSGLPADLKSYRQCLTKTEFINFIYEIKAESPLNKQVIYSDFGFILLGFIIEHFERSIPDYLNEILFKPLNMINTTYHLSPFQKEITAKSENSPTRGLIHGEVHDGKAFLLNGESGNAGLFSNTIDLSKFAKMLLNNGNYENQSILKSETVNLLKDVYTKHLNEPRTLGWMSRNKNANQGDYLSDSIIFHTGFAGTSFLLDFEKELAIILLSNRINPSRNNKNIFNTRPTLHNLIYLNI